MIYELINPSDAVTFDTDDEEALCVAVTILGEGWYGLERQDGTQALGICAMGNAVDGAMARVQKFFQEPSYRERMAAALRTVLYCSKSSRAALNAAFAPLGEDERRAAVDRFNDKKRGSMNNIGKACLAYAEKLEGLAREAAK